MRTLSQRPSVQRVTLLLLLSLATACGSTAQSSGSATLATGGGDSGSGDGLSVPGLVGGGSGLGDGTVADATGGGSTGSGTDALAGGQAGGSSSGGSATGGGSGAGTAGGGSATGGGSTGAAASRGKVPGVENGVIKIGMIRTKNNQEAYKAIGAEGLAGSGINEQMKQALVDEINNNGGIHGLKVKIVPYDYDQTDATTSGTVHSQRACAAWTQDDRVFAAFAGEGPVLDACLTKAGVLQVCDFCAVSTYDAKAMAEVPLLYSPNGVLISRQVDFYVKGLVQAGYFTGDVAGVPGPPKMGFLAMDTPIARRQFPRLDAELKARTGQAFAEKGFLSNDDQAQFTGQLQNFLLQFKAAGVNRILIFDAAGTIAGFGMQTADKNGYTPRWGLNSTSGAGVLHGQGLIPASQLPGLTTVGWMPAGDIGLQKGQGAVWPPGLQGCVAIMKKAGLNPTSDTDLGIAGRYCDAFLYFRDAMRAAPRVTVQDFGSGVASLGDRFKTSLIYGSFSSSARRDMGSTYRTVRYDRACNCFKYVGPFQQM